MSTTQLYDGAVQRVGTRWVVTVKNDCGATVHLQGPMGIPRDRMWSLVRAYIQDSGSCVVFFSDKELNITNLSERAGRDLLKLLQGSFTVVGGGTVRWRLGVPSSSHGW